MQLHLILARYASKFYLQLAGRSPTIVHYILAQGLQEVDFTPQAIAVTDRMDYKIMSLGLSGIRVFDTDGQVEGRLIFHTKSCILGNRLIIKI